MARSIIGHDILPSSGFGAEILLASLMGKTVFSLHDARLRTSRMQIHRVIRLQYNNFEEERDIFKEIFAMAFEYEPGIGLNNQNKPILLGFKNGRGNPINLEQEIYDAFPNQRYVYNPNSPIVALTPTNSGRFYESSFRHKIYDTMMYSMLAWTLKIHKILDNKTVKSLYSV